MKAIKNGFAALILCCVLLLLATCTSPTTANKQIQIVDIGWVYLNADFSYWNDGFSAATCSAYFWIYYSGDEISIADIEYARCHMPNDQGSWDFPVDSGHLDVSRKVIHSNWNYTTDIASNGSAFPIGDMVFEIGLRGGSAVSYTFSIPAPGQLASGGKTVTYTEDYADTKQSNYVAMLKRPVSISHSKSGSSIDIAFQSTDPIFFSGNVEFYDIANNRVGGTAYFRAYGTGAIASYVNGGGNLDNTGVQNNLSITSADISYETGKGYADIAKYRIFLSDGFQYLGTAHTYDCYSVGPLTTF